MKARPDKMRYKNTISTQKLEGMAFVWCVSASSKDTPMRQQRPHLQVLRSTTSFLQLLPGPPAHLNSHARSIACCPELSPGSVWQWSPVPARNSDYRNANYRLSNPERRCTEQLNYCFYGSCRYRELVSYVLGMCLYVFYLQMLDSRSWDHHTPSSP